MKKSIRLAVAERRQPSTHKDFLSPSPAISVAAPPVPGAEEPGNNTGCGGEIPKTCHDYDGTPTPLGAFAGGRGWGGGWLIRRPRYNCQFGVTYHWDDYDDLDGVYAIDGTDYVESRRYSHVQAPSTEPSWADQQRSSMLELMMNRENKPLSSFAQCSGATWVVRGTFTPVELGDYQTLLICTEANAATIAFQESHMDFPNQSNFEPQGERIIHNDRGDFIEITLSNPAVEPGVGGARLVRFNNARTSVAQQFADLLIEEGESYTFDARCGSTTSTLKIWKTTDPEPALNLISVSISKTVRPQFGLGIVDNAGGADINPARVAFSYLSLGADGCLGAGPSADKYSDDCGTIIDPQSGDLIMHSLQKVLDYGYAPSLGANIVRNYDEVFVDGFKVTNWSQNSNETGTYVQFSTTISEDSVVTATFRIL